MAFAPAHVLKNTQKWVDTFPTTDYCTKHKKTIYSRMEMPAIAEEEPLKLENSSECEISVVPFTTPDSNNKDADIDSYPIIVLASPIKINVYCDGYVLLPKSLDTNNRAEDSEGYFGVPSLLNQVPEFDLLDPEEDLKPMYYDTVSTILAAKRLDCSTMSDSQKKEYMPLILAKSRFYDALSQWYHSKEDYNLLDPFPTKNTSPY